MDEIKGLFTLMFRKAKAMVRAYLSHGSIKKKFQRITLAQTVIPLIMVGICGYIMIENFIRDKSIRYSMDVLRVVGIRLQDSIENITLTSQDLLYEEQIYRVFQAGENGNSLTNYEKAQQINGILKRIILSRNDIESICLFRNGEDYYYSDNNVAKSSLREVALYDDMLDAAQIVNGKPVWYLDGQGRSVQNVYLTRLIRDKDSLEEIGLMVIQVKIKYLETLLQGLMTKNALNIAVFSADFQQISARNKDESYLDNDRLFSLISGNSGSVIDRKNNTLVTFVSMGSPDWIICSYVPLKILLEDTNALKWMLLLVTLLSITVMSFIGIRMATDIVNPINKLAETMMIVNSGNGTYVLETDRDDELGILNNAFNRMIKENKRLIKVVYQEQIMRTESEIKALQAQINPHFLFNTLETINWIAQLNDVTEVSDIVTSLSALMDASIGRGDKFISVREEFEYVEHYLSIMKKRYENRFDFIKTVECGVEEIKIPRLLIQPLIENAVYHGVKKRLGNVTVSLSAGTEDGKLIIVVMDNGVGIGAKVLSEINSRLKIDNDTYFKQVHSGERKHVGIDNVNRRIKLLYGDKYGLRIESTEGEYTRIAVEIPMREGM